MRTRSSMVLSAVVVALLMAISALPLHAYYIEIIDPIEGATYAPCGPDMVAWVSDLPPGPGPVILRLSWRPQGGSWEVFAVDDNNAGADHPWPSPPCYMGWYEVRVEYIPDPSVGDTVSFYVDGGTQYINITTPEYQREYYCAPSEVRWDSNIDPNEGNVLEVTYRRSTGWGWIDGTVGVSNNDGVIQWNDPPCGVEYPHECEVRVQYTPDPSVYDVVEFVLVEDDFPVDGPYGIFIDFSGDAAGYIDIATRVDPPQYTSFEAYVALLGSDDLTTVSFAVKVVPAGVLAPLSFESLLPGGLSIGSLDTGVTVTSTECMSAGNIVYLARLGCFYLGGEADIEIRDHPDYPRWVVNCEDEVGYYEVANHGGVGKEPVSTPVETMSWGAIKAMYRD